LHGRVEGKSARLDRLAARAEHVLRLTIVHRRSDVGILAAILSLEILVEDFNCAFVDLLVLVVLQRLDLAQAVRLLDEVRIPENKMITSSGALCTRPIPRSKANSRAVQPRCSVLVPPVAAAI
jgi:hypothetical protein